MSISTPPHGHGAAQRPDSFFARAIRALSAGALALVLGGCSGGGGGDSTPPTPGNQPPTARLVVSAGSVLVGQTLSLNASTSSDSDGSIASYAWDFGDGSTIGGSAASVSHSYAAQGNYTARVTVTDSQGASGTAVATLTVGAADTTASVQANLVNPITGQEVRLDPSASSSANGRIARYDWYFYDGRTASTTTPEVQHVSWPSPGAHFVRLTVTDSAGASNVAPLVVQVASFAPTGRLNDTGIDWCSSNVDPGPDWLNNLVCSTLSWVGNLWGTMQDAYFGRDAEARDGSLTKIGRGAAGFDFTRIGADGLPLTVQDGIYSDTGNEVAGTRWDCVRDNTTGLIWEVKRNDPTHLRHVGHVYTWYSTDSANNGGVAGFENKSTPNASGLPYSCTGVADTSKCNTQSYTTAVNAQPAGQALCGFRDWRMPTLEELAGLTLAGREDPAIDVNQFNYTRGSLATGTATWTSAPFASYPNYAWLVEFYSGSHDRMEKSYALQVRLVRSGQ